MAVLLTVLLPAQEISQSGLQLKAPRAMVAQPERAQHAMVATVHELATQAGLDVLRKGGNAVDAAVAIGFALAVVHPEAGNIGGGGYMLVRMADGRTAAIDYRETAPAAAKPAMFKAPSDARVGYKASAVPGTVAGLAMAHKMFAAKSWRDDLEPARRLADRGFPASQRMELILALQVPVMVKFPETARIFLHASDRPQRQNEILRQPDLAATIARIQKNGWREFYEGETARRIDADMRANNGTILLNDLKNYKAILREPLKGSYRGNPILTMPPSTSGGMALLGMLNILENFPMPLGMEGSSDARHLQIEAMRRAYRDRSLYAADPAFVRVPIEMVIGKQHAKELAATVHLKRATLMNELGPDPASGESHDTTHFTVVDQAGNIVSNTYTLNGYYGSQVIPKGTGVLLNDIMSGFATRSGGSKNDIQPGKRPVSSMTPVIALHADGSPWFALGSPGAATIPNTVFQVIVNIIDFKMSLRDAIEYPRIHHQFVPDRVDAEPGALVFDVAQKLRAMGHTLNPSLRSQGDVHAIMLERQTGWRLGWSDGRRGGKALGY
jgi:gamma-glutamyltranspeptidase/glutathione hydrolase